MKKLFPLLLAGLLLACSDNQEAGNHQADSQEAENRQAGDEEATAQAPNEQAAVPVEEEPGPDPGGKRVYGRIPNRLVRWFTNDAGIQDFSGFSDGDRANGAWHTNWGNKVFLNPNISYALFDLRADVEIDRVDISDGQGDNALGVRFGCHMRDKARTFFKGVIPTWYGKNYLTVDQFKVAPQQQKMRAFVMEVDINNNQLPAGTMPAEIEFYGWYNDLPAVTYKRPEWPVENGLGVVGYVYDFDNPSSEGINMEKVEMAKAVGPIRLYLDSHLMRKEGKWSFEPFASGGGWRLDGITKALMDNGNDVTLCLKQDEGRTDYPDGCRQLAIRYGSNKNVPNSSVNVYLGDAVWWQKEHGRNVVKKGLGYVKSIQLGNEPNRWWKGRADLANQQNLEGFVSPFELAAIYTKCYNAIKEVDPNMEVVLAGLATTSPGYIDAMFFWAEVHNEGRPICDAIAYHDYCKASQNGQRMDEGPAAPPELTTFRKNAENMLQMLASWGRPLSAMITETGYSIATVNPDQAVSAIGPWNRFEVQGIYTIRTALESLRAGIKKVTAYQLYDDTNFINNPNAWLPWDLGCGIADGNKRRPATDYSLQVKNLMAGYVMTTPANHGDAVYVDKFEKPGQKTIYTLLVPEDKDIRRQHTLSLPGVKQVAVCELVTGAERMTERIVNVNGFLSIEVTIKPTFVRVVA